MKKTDYMINELVQNSNFVTIVEELVNKNVESYMKYHQNSLSKTRLNESQFFQEFGEMVCLTVEEKLSKVLDKEFIDVERQVDILKEEMFAFVEEQATLTCEMRKDLNKGLEEIRRKTTTQKVINNIQPIRGTSVKLMRTNLKSAIEESERKGLSQEVSEIKKQIQLLQKFVEKEHTKSTF